MKPMVHLQCIEEVLDVSEGSLRGDELLRDLENWDSLAFLSFLAMADTRFGIKVTPAELRACVSVEDLCKLLSAKPA
jgi:acyl carrier protein